MVELNHILFHLQESVKDKINFIRNSISADKIQIESQNDYCYLTLNYPQFNLQSNKLKKKKTSSNSLTFRTKLLVASEGGNSAIRGKMNFETAANKYNETGLICTLRGSEASEIAFQRFLHNGTFALLPLYDNLFSIVCSLPKSVNEELKKFDNSKFLAFVNNVLRNPSEMDASRLEKLITSKSVGYYKQPPLMEEIISSKLEFDLQLQYAVNPVDKNIVLIGDSPHVIHPFAGQALNLGVMDSAFLADEIVKALSNGRNVNDLKALQAFTYSSQMNSRLMIATVESIRALYGPTSGFLSALRNLGIAIGNSSEIMRGLFILSASGIPEQPRKFAWEK
jgi:2-polyprenyl-6-methoxyphenol hydroxylase-like FAD-dependent oxidoreductase